MGQLIAWATDNWFLITIVIVVVIIVGEEIARALATRTPESSRGSHTEAPPRPSQTDEDGSVPPMVFESHSTSELEMAKRAVEKGVVPDDIIWRIVWQTDPNRDKCGASGCRGYASHQVGDYPFGALVCEQHALQVLSATLDADIERARAR